MRIARVFPSRIKNATPTDPLAFVGLPNPMFPPEVDEVHISVAFTWDKQRAEEVLAPAWEHVAPVKIGGPAYGQPSGEFVPGMYLKKGYTITSRGCPNHCSFCSVPKREPRLIELPIQPGHMVQDDNLLACSERHIINVFRMLGRQRSKAHLYGLEAKRLKPWHVDFLAVLWPAALWFAFDEPADYEPLRVAGQMLQEAGFDRSRLNCYILCGQDRDRKRKAFRRARLAWEAGFMPFAMLWRYEDGCKKTDWARFQKILCRPAATKEKMRRLNCGLTRCSIRTGGRLPQATLQERLVFQE